MKKTRAIAQREFVATVATKGFLLGVVLFPLIMLVGLLVVPLLTSSATPNISGTVVVIDRSTDEGTVAAEIERRLSPDALANKQREDLASAADAAGDLIGDQTADAVHNNHAVLAGVPTLRVRTLPADARLEEVLAPLRAPGGDASDDLAVLVINPTAVRKGESEAAFGSYEMYTRPRLDERIQDLVRSAAVNSIRTVRIRHAGLQPPDIETLYSVGRGRVMTVTADGERRSFSGAQFFIPVAFMMLLWISAFTGGQYLLTTTIEEKSNRVMEVLLSAASPMQIMIGKIVGQMCVGLLILLIYAGLGSGALFSFKLMHVMDWTRLPYLVVFFFIAFFLVASMMAAVGSAVTEVHEAQSLMGPVMMVLIVPLLLLPAVIANPNSTLAVVLSLVPPFSPFVMVTRISASAEPIAWWQLALSIAIGIAAVVFSAWVAAKVFRIGVLMYGKPPNLATLIRWVRMA